MEPNLTFRAFFRPQALELPPPTTGARWTRLCFELLFVGVSIEDQCSDHGLARACKGDRARRQNALCEPVWREVLAAG